MEPLIIANWKCNPVSFFEAKKLFGEIKKNTKGIGSAETVICPPFIYLSDIKRLSSNIKLGAQNCFFENKGAFTGEISPLMFKNLGVEYVILGHSERRKYFGETDEMIGKKLIAAMKVKLKPILCIGETKEEREEEKTAEILKTQLKNALTPVASCQLPVASLIVAYEPIWAIGTGNSCLPAEAMSNLLFIKKQLMKYREIGAKPISRNRRETIKILYGGSVNSKNAKDYIDAGFDGLLVGGASLKAKEFGRIVKLCNI